MTTRRTRRQQVELLVAAAVSRPDADAAVYAAAIRERLPADALVECPVCGRVGLPGQVVAHDCTR